jgi:hypothetical protein
VRSPDGREWKVRRLWLPRLRRRPQLGLGQADGAYLGSSGDDLLGVVLGAVAVVVILILGVLFLPYVVLVLELVVLPLVILFRIVFKRPFTVEAATQGKRRSEQVRGWRESGRAVERMAREIEQGAYTAAKRRDVRRA